MRRVLLALLLLSVAFAVDIDGETGCEIYPDHLICPQGTDIEAAIKYTSDAECFSVQNEFGNLGNVGCTATAELRRPLEYQDCRMYVPFGESDIILDKIDYDYQCSTEKIAGGTVVQVIGFEEQYTGCMVVNETEYTGDYLCPVKGKDYTVSGNVAFLEGQYSIMLYSQEEKTIGIPFVEDMATPMLLLAIGVLLIYALYIWSGRKR